MKSGHTIRVGITAVGSGIGQSIVHSCRLSSLPLHLVGYDTSALAYGAYDCHEHCRVPLSTVPDYPEQLLARCVEDRVELLIPGLDLDLPILAEHAPRFEEQGVRVLVGGVDFIRLSRDKRVWGRTLNEFCTHILTGFTPEEAVEAIQAGLIHFPLIAKPAGGSASAGVRIVKSTDELASISADFVVQPYAMPRGDDPSSSAIRAALEQSRLIQVAEISYQWLVSKDGEIQGRMATRNRLKDGVPIEIIPIDDAPYWEVLSPLVPYLQEKGMRGPVNFQGRMTEDGPRFFEMNGRFTGITGLRALFGFNEVDVAIRSFTDQPVAGKRLMVNTRRLGLRQVAERVVSTWEHPALKAVARQQVPEWRDEQGLRILVTGATGWLGRHLIHALLERESVDRVYGMVRSMDRALAIWPEPDERLQLWAMGDLDLADARFADVDMVYHLAAERDMKNGAGHASSMTLTRQLVQAAAQVHLPRFVYLSSQSVYGVSRPPPWPESLSPDPANTYAMDKCAGEQLVSLLSHVSRASRSTSIRLARLYGAADGLRWSELPHKFAREAAQGAVLQISGGGQLFDLLHIRDAVLALTALLDVPQVGWAPVYNVGGGDPVSIIRLAEEAVAAARRAGCAGAAVDVQPSETPPMRFGMDCALFQSHSGWQPAITLSAAMDGLMECLASEMPAKN